VEQASWIGNRAAMPRFEAGRGAVDLSVAVLLFAAGIAGGGVNAIAGGGTLITFPAMLAAGLPPVIANASNAVAVTPGCLVAAFADRAKLPKADVRLAVTLLAAVVGGGLGAILLLVTSDRLFTLLVPALIGLAALVYACAGPIQRGIARRFGAHGDHATARTVLLGPATVYGGYFGAGVGVLLLAVFSVTGREDVRAANALKNLLATAVNVTTIAIFAEQGVVRWPQTLIMLLGAIVGGILGERLVRTLPATAVRAVVALVGAAMTLVYGWKYWM
jgi:uncharacterized membrane protein YfcA